MRIDRLAPAAAVGLLLALPAAAEPYVLDKSHAHVTFSVSHLGFTDTQGVFREFDAEIDFDPEAMEQASVSFVIQAASVDTFWGPRDDHIRSGDFLNVAEHPEITFTSREVRPTSDVTAEVVGDVTLRGVTREEVFEVTLNRIGPSPFNADLTIAGFTVTGTLDRRDYGISYGAPAIGAEIPIRLELEASPRSQVED